MTMNDMFLPPCVSLISSHPEVSLGVYLPKILLGLFDKGKTVDNI
jgi:hypothetical protein